MAMFHGNAAGTDMPIANLDYGYIRGCNSSEEVETILAVLRSGSEGFYPNLIETAEERLRLLNPKSKLLIKEQKAKTLADLEKDEAAKWSSELSSWAEQLKQSQGGGGTGVEEDGGEDDCLPPVRKPATISGKAGPPPKPPVAGSSKPSERIKSRDYKEWDKFVAKESKKADKEDPEESMTVNGSAATAGKEKPMNNVQPQISAKERALPIAQKQLLAAREKDKGNEAFRSGDYHEAVAYYSRSIELSPSAAAFNNRAMAGLKMDKFGSAMEDCTEVLRMEPHNTKALFRRATAYSSMESYAKAVADYEHLLQMEPNNKKAQLELNALRKKKLPREEMDGASSSSKPAKKGRRIQIKEVDGSSSEDDDGKAARMNNTPSSNSQASPSPPPNLNSEPPPAAVPPPMPPAVKALKDEGNDLFQRGQYGDAILLYTRAIELLLDDADVSEHSHSYSVLLNNRAACHFKNGDCRQTMNDTTESITLQPLNFKALVRRAQAYEAMEKYRQAYNDFHMAMRVDGRNEMVQNACSRLARTLSEMDGREWRSKLPPHPEQAAIFQAMQPQSVVTSSTESTPMVVVETDQVDGTLVTSEVPLTPENVIQVDDTNAVTGESPPETAKVVASYVINETVKDEAAEINFQPFEDEPSGVNAAVNSTDRKQDESSTDSEDQIDLATTTDHADYAGVTPSQPNATDTVDAAKTSDFTEDEENEAANMKREASDHSDLSQPGSLSETPPSDDSDDDKDSSSSLPSQPSSDEATVPPATGDDNITSSSDTVVPPPLDSPFPSTSEPAAMPGSLSEQLPSSVPIVTSTAATVTTNVTHSTDTVTSTTSLTSPSSAKKQARRKKKQEEESRTPEDIEAQFESWKNRGNEYVRKQDYVAAMRCYNLCTSLSPKRALIFTNRALCYLKTNEPLKAETDCTHALAIEPGNVKALYRRGLSRKAMMRYGEAVKDLKMLLDLDPENAIAKKEFAEVKQLWEKELRELQSTKTGGGSTSPLLASKTTPQPRPFSPLSNVFRHKDGSAPPSGVRESRADRRRNSREARTAMRNLRRVARQLPTDSTAPSGPLNKEKLQSLLEEIQAKVGQDSPGKPEQSNKRPGKDRLMTAGKTTYYDKEEGKHGKSESNSDPFGLRGAKEAGEVNRATEKAARGGHSSKSHSKKLKSGGSKRKKVTVTVRERSSDEEDALQKASKLTDSSTQVDAIVSSEATETGTDPSSQMDAPVNSEVTATVDEVEHTDSIAPDHPMSSVTADPNAEVDEVTQDDPKVDEVTPTDHQTTTTDQTAISEEEFARPDLSSDGPLDVPSLEETPDSTTSDKAVPDSVPAAAAAAKTSGKSETTLKPATPYEFVQRWNSVSRSSQSTEYAKLLEEIPPSSLPQVITNKLDGTMLTSIISAVDGHFIPKGLHQQGADILETLTQVQRFGMVSMFLSSAEKKSLQSIFSTLSEEGKADVEVDRLRVLYGVK